MSSFRQRALVVLDLLGHFTEWFPLPDKKVPVVAGDAVDAGLAGCGYKDRRMGQLDRLWLHRHVVEQPELPGVVEGLGGGPGLVQDLHGLFESPAGLIHGDVQLVELTPLKAPSHAEIHPAVAQQVYRRHLLSQLDGIVEWQDNHGGAQTDALGDPRQIGQQRHGGRDDSVAGEVVFGDPHRVKPEFFGM